MKHFCIQMYYLGLMVMSHHRSSEYKQTFAASLLVFLLISMVDWLLINTFCVSLERIISIFKVA